jgi:hypothetical protein
MCSLVEKQTVTAAGKVRELLVLSLYGTSRCGAGGFAKLVTRNVEKGKTPTSLREGLEIRLDKDLNRLFSGINLDTHRRITKIDLMASSVLSANDGVGHYLSL